jgi:hypothetical protein
VASMHSARSGRSLRFENRFKLITIYEDIWPVALLIGPRGTTDGLHVCFKACAY